MLCHELIKSEIKKILFFKDDIVLLRAGLGIQIPNSSEPGKLGA
jgi:F420-0:gamma-glutamyl ligase